MSTGGPPGGAGGPPPPPPGYTGEWPPPPGWRPPPGMFGRPPLPPGYKEGDTRVPIIIAVTVVFGFLSTTLVLLRFYVRGRMLKAVGLEDWLVLAALIAFWTNAAIGLWGTTIGFGRHNTDGLPEWINRLRIMAVIIPAFYHLGIFFVQTSILTFYIRLSFPDWFKRLAMLLMVFGFANGAAGFIGNLIYCWPRGEETKCYRMAELWYVNGALGLFIDLCIWALPIYPLWNLNMNSRKRMALILTFCVGVFVNVATSVRLSLVGEGAINDDESWKRALIHIIAVCEVGLAITCCCMPVLRPLLDKMGGNTRNSTGGSDGHGVEGGYRLEKTDGTGGSAVAGRWKAKMMPKFATPTDTLMDTTLVTGTGAKATFPPAGSKGAPGTIASVAVGPKAKGDDDDDDDDSYADGDLEMTTRDTTKHSETHTKGPGRISGIMKTLTFDSTSTRAPRVAGQSETQLAKIDSNEEATRVGTRSSDDELNAKARY